MKVKLPTIMENIFSGRIMASLAFSLLFAGACFSQVYINEVSGNDKWLEIYNAGDSQVDLTGYTLVKIDEVGEESEWIITSSAGATIPAKGYKVWERNQYDTTGSTFTWGISARKNLSIKLLDRSGSQVDYFEINHELFSDGGGRTVGRKVDGSDELIIFSQGTKSASNNNGTPLTPNQEPKKIYVNEISGNEKWMEIYNGESSSVDISGYRVLKVDETGSGNFWTIPSGTTIPANGCRSWTQDPDNTSGSTFTFGISAKKNILFKIYDKDFTVVDYFEVDHTLFSEGGERTVGRRTDGADELVLFTNGGTKGSTNTSDKILQPTANPKKLYVNEISGNEKWLEIYNAENEKADLTGYSLLKIDEYGAGTFWQIPNGTTIEADGFIVWEQGEDESVTFTWGISARKDVAFKIYDGNFTALDYFEVRENLYSEGGQQTVGRKTDGAEELVVFATGTKNASNGKASSVNDLQGEENTIAYVQNKVLYLLTDISSFSLMDVSGNIVFSKDTNKDRQINLSFLNDGIYILQIKDKNNLRTMKVLIK